MGSENDDNSDSGSSSANRSRPNEVRLQAGRIEVEVQGFASEEELVELASEQMQDQMRQWVEVDRQVVSTEPETVLFGGGER